MSATEDLISFDIIEDHKENIQSLPGGRSARALVSTFVPPSLLSSTPTPGDTRNLNDAIREEFELEIIAISDSDDPLDIYDRYIKWTLSAYPSAQATPESQLRPLLERATRAFQTASHYKNDPRYLKLWLTYIRLFSDAPRETFAYLARHGIGEGLALFYEEFSAWLEGAERWTQADEVYKLGIEREARPAERLVRKFGEFQHRFEQRVQNGDEPSSPALPTVRPALVAKIDPFALSTPRPVDAQAQRLSGIGGSSTSRGGRQKLAIFSDTDAPASSRSAISGETAKGWENIGSIAERKKENVMEARPWAGETLKAGKKYVAPPKMTIFKDEPTSQISPVNQIEPSRYANQQQITNSRTGKVERVFVNLEAVYPNPDDPNEEMSFEELRAKARGWADKDWAAENKRRDFKGGQSQQQEQQPASTEVGKNIEYMLAQDVEQNSSSQNASELYTDSNVDDEFRSQKCGRPKKMKIREVKAEVQTIKTNLESPTGPKLRRKNSAEPTMTLHTKAANNDILDIFNQPLGNPGILSSQPESAGESDYDDDDYTSNGESTGTGRISGLSECGDDETDTRNMIHHEETDAASGSPWSDFTASKHVPKLGSDEAAEGEESAEVDQLGFVVLRDKPITIDRKGDVVDIAPISPEPEDEPIRHKFIPLPPEDYAAPNQPFRNPSQAIQNRLLFMTPIVEKTESSLGALTISKQKDYFSSKTPSRSNDDLEVLETEGQSQGSPFQEIINEAKTARAQAQAQTSPRSRSKANLGRKKCGVPGPIIKDTQCNPMDESIRQTILDHLQPQLSSYPGFFDQRPRSYNKGAEIRKYIKALAKASKCNSEKTATSLSLPPTLDFANPSGNTYTIRRELGKGAFAPVYLIQQNTLDQGRNPNQPSIPRLLALKCEDPPTPWEFYIMNTLHSRLPTEAPFGRSPTPSLLIPHALHLFADEAYLIEQYFDQGTLLNLVNLAKPDSAGVLDEAIAMFFTVELLRTVETMHSVGILHGDLKADNCLVRLPPTPSAAEWDPEYHASGAGGWVHKGLCLIDFGRGIDLWQFTPQVQFIADWKTGKADCAEMREMRPWTWQIDYWGMAGVAHSLLFGKYIEDVALDVRHHRASPSSLSSSTPSPAALEPQEPGLGPAARRWKLKEPLKRYWQTELWAALFDALLNPGAYASPDDDSNSSGTNSVSPPLARALSKCRREMEGWLEREAGRRGLKAGLRRLEERIREQRR